MIIYSRRRINQMHIVRGPDKILLTLEDLTFIIPSLSNKVSSPDINILKIVPTVNFNDPDS